MIIRVVMKLMYMFLVAFGLITSVRTEPIPDSISQGGVTIDFTQNDPLVIQKWASIQEVAKVASDWFERYLKQNFEMKNVSVKDLYLLAFCLETFDVQVEGLRRFAENAMGLSGSKDGKFDFPVSELKIRDLNLHDSKICIRKSIRETLKACPYEESPELMSYCAQYNYRKGWAFSDDKTISRVLVQARENINKQERGGNLDVLSLDPSRYGKYEELKRNLDLLKTEKALSLIGVAGGGGTAVAGFGLAWTAAGTAATAGTAAAAGTAATAGTILGLTPVGWVAIGVAGTIGAGCCVYTYLTSEDGYLKVRKAASEDIHRYVMSLDDRSAYQSVLASDSGPYQKAYMDLVRIQQFIINWKQSGWFGWEGLTELDKHEFDEWAERIRIRSRDALTELEDRLVNYPLMGNILEAQSACLYLDYLRVKDYDMELKKDEERKEYEDVRAYWLANSQKVAELCSELSLYSTTPLLQGEIRQYNLYLQFTYATNYNTTIKAKAKEDEQDIVPPVFDARERAQVVAGCIKTKMRSEYDQAWSAYDRLKYDETLSNVVEVIVGRDRLTEWERSVEAKIREYWMYPSWSAEAMTLGLPVTSTQVLELLNGYSDPMERIRLTLKAAIQLDNELEPLAMLSNNVWKSARTKEEAQGQLVKFIGRRKIPDEVESQIRNGYGSVEKLAQRWVDGVFHNVPVRGLERKSTQLYDIVQTLKDEVLPLWREIKRADIKWYYRIF